LPRRLLNCLFQPSTILLSYPWSKGETLSATKPRSVKLHKGDGGFLRRAVEGKSGSRTKRAVSLCKLPEIFCFKNTFGNQAPENEKCPAHKKRGVKIGFILTQGT